MCVLGICTNMFWTWKQEVEEPTPDPLPESDTDDDADEYSDFVRVPGGGMCNITLEEVRT